MDLFMLQLRKFTEQQLEQATEDALEPEGSPMKFDFGMTHSYASIRHSNSKHYSLKESPEYDFFIFFRSG